MKRAVAILSLLALFAACTKSRLADDADVRVSGRAVHQDGSPVSATRVVLMKEPDAGEVIGGLFLAVVTLGLVCLLDQPPTICSRARKSTSDATGGFAFTMKGRDTHGSFGGASTFHLSTQEAAQASGLGGAASAQAFQIQDEDLHVPDLRLWEPAVTLAPGPSWEIGFEAVPATGYGKNPKTSVLFRTVDKAVVWSQPAVPGERLDERVLEDADGALVLTATSSQAGPGSVFDHTFHSREAAFTGTAGPPPSRGATCTGHGENGPVALPTCPVTDGKYGVGWAALPESPCSPDGGAADGGGGGTDGGADGGSECQVARANNWIQVDMGADVALVLLVVRGPSFPPSVVESSADGTAWAKLGDVGAGTSRVVPPTGARGRFVRLRGGKAGDRINGVTEISVW